MASILDRYGIKEVADVTFYQIGEDGQPGAPVLYLDTLKVSTSEQTAENTSARGGKGNAELIIWDYGKEITVNLEDALFSAKSMAVMFGSVDGEGNPVVDTASTSIIKTVRASEIVGTNQVVINGTTVTATDIVYYTATGSSTESSTDAAYATFHYTPTEAHTITISAETFPGTYYVTGDTYARSEINGLDDFFQFIIPKAKVLSEVTLTMEAEGDPSTFTMNLKVLRPSDGKMMKLVRYAI